MSERIPISRVTDWIHINTKIKLDMASTERIPPLWTVKPKTVIRVHNFKFKLIELQRRWARVFERLNLHTHHATDHSECYRPRKFHQNHTFLLLKHKKRTNK